MPLDDLPADGKPHPRPLLLAVPTMKSLERRENLPAMLLVEADAVIFNNDLKIQTVGFCASHLDNGLLPISVELESMAYEVR